MTKTREIYVVLEDNGDSGDVRAISAHAESKSASGEVLRLTGEKALGLYSNTYRSNRVTLHEAEEVTSTSAASLAGGVMQFIAENSLWPRGSGLGVEAFRSFLELQFDQALRVGRQQEAESAQRSPATTSVASTLTAEVIRFLEENCLVPPRESGVFLGALKAVLREKFGLAFLAGREHEFIEALRKADAKIIVGG